MRTVRHERDADVALEAAKDKWSGTNAVCEALTWTLARDPLAGTPLSESGNVQAYTIQGARSANWPTLTAVYQTEGDVISIETAKFEEPKNIQSGTRIETPPSYLRKSLLRIT